MATLAWPTHEQQICLDAVAIDGRLVAKRLVTTRSGGIAAALAGRPLADIPQIVSQLFPLCGMAHAVAALAAIETALRIEVSPAQSAFRALILLAEHSAALGWRILMDWPPLLGDAPEVRACADIRRAAAAVSAVAERVSGNGSAERGCGWIARVSAEPCPNSPACSSSCFRKRPIRRCLGAS